MCSFTGMDDLDESKSTFIDKLLVEMKSEFNKNTLVKSDKQEEKVEKIKEVKEAVNLDLPPELKPETPSEKPFENEGVELPPPMISRNDSIVTDIVTINDLRNPKPSTSKVKTSPISRSSSDAIIEKDESMDEGNLEDGDKTKPRIVLTFRTEKSKPMVTSNYENAKDNNRSEETVSPGRRSLRIKTNSFEEKEKRGDCEQILKRSARRRSKDFTESILQSAIARKEKSYNETSRPQRLTRRLKPTPKILANLEMSKNNSVFRSERLKQSTLKNKNSKPSPTIERQKFSYDKLEKMSELTESENEIEEPVKISEQLHKRFKRKKKIAKNTKVQPKKTKLKSENSGKNSDSDSSFFSVQESIDDVKLEPKSTRRKSSSESDINKSCRRSHRKSGRPEGVDGPTDSVVSEAVSGAVPESDTVSPSHQERNIPETETLFKKCLCRCRSHIYAKISTMTEPFYCGASDSIAGKVVGCSNVITQDCNMLRPSRRIPYTAFCLIHKERLIRHNCCPTCGLFCTQGNFVQCSNNHQYHRDCQVIMGNTGLCPHCGSDTPEDDIEILFKCENKPIFLPHQKSNYPSAKMSFAMNPEAGEEEINVRAISPVLISPALLEAPKSDQIEDIEEEINVQTLYQAISSNNCTKVFSILSRANLNLSEVLDVLDGSTVLHFACQEGYLNIVHMLVISGAELDVLDKEQSTPLMIAIQNFQNNVVRYLIKCGASISLKGSDGMTALHIAAKYGNLEAVDLLLRAFGLGSRDSWSRINSIDDGGWTALVWACEHSRKDVVMRLLQAGADPLLRDVEQNIALHWAAFSGNTQITETLLNYGSDVNAINAHGDSPLHIAARQNNYNCVVVLLARGADVRIMNGAEETPLDCCTQPPGDCYYAISFNVQMQAVTEPNEETIRKITILSNDISRGREINPLQCVNTVDAEPMPKDFLYILDNCITSDIFIDRKLNLLQGCQCGDRCTSYDCVCTNKSLRCWYDSDGKLSTDFNYTDPPMLFECNLACGCNAITCHNRVVQRGTNQRFQLFRTAPLTVGGRSARGWGICTLRAIPRGTYVCEYVGEIISDTDADQREDDSYLFDLDNRDGDTYCIDARRFGNLSRFINHSCDPNLLPVRIYIDHQDLRFPRIAFFAKRDIPAGEELGFDYGEKFWIIKYKSFTCTCGHPNCKYSETTIKTTLENYQKRLIEENGVLMEAEQS